MSPLPEFGDSVEMHATLSDIAEIAAYLQQHLGQRATAYLSGLKDPKTVGHWARGRVHPRDVASLRMRHGYQALRLIMEAFGDQTAKAWFFGTNRQLGGHAPAHLLRHSTLPEEVAEVVGAARSFVESGRRTGQQSGAKDQVQEARRFARLLVEEIKLFQSERETVVPPHSVSRLTELLREEGSVSEQVQVVELAREQIKERLDETVDRIEEKLREISKQGS